MRRSGDLRDEDREVIGARYLLGLSEAETAAGAGRSRPERSSPGRPGR